MFLKIKQQLLLFAYIYVTDAYHFQRHFLVVKLGEQESESNINNNNNKCISNAPNPSMTIHV